MAKIAFIGLGKMGFGVAARMLEAGRQLGVYNRTASRAERLVHPGAHPYDTPRGACEGADEVVSMLADDAASQAVWAAHDGILEADLAKDGFAIECSTLSHGRVMRLAEGCAARGLRCIDAPVTGLPDAAAAGSLTLLVGARASDLDAVRDTPGALCTRIIRFGPIGAGTAYKLIINMVGAVQITCAAEAMAIAERAGLDLAVVAEAIASSQAASPQVVRNAHRMTAGDHQDNIVVTSALRSKDVDYGLRFAREIGIGSPFGALAERTYRQLCELGHEHVNESTLIDICRSQPVQT